MSDSDSTHRSKRKTDTGSESLTAGQILAGLETLGVADLRQVVASAEAQIQAKADVARQAFVAETLDKAKALGLSIRDLFGEVPSAPKRGRGKAKTSGGEGVQPKYKGPNGELWSGRGRTPKWVQLAEAEGKSRNDYLIK
ncbi:H-NS histone family protein [Belnapia sp. T18]|uniref:H-NS histone family protein n=1 Tax=Belnapia arida TaxID=2804533 RepID=A0ABS1UDH8_9PROT|nr:H-NS histone family protein [Belnapia arida]MBL6082718.1 H-NS histone family protein [Belnapia arida]